VVVDDAVVERAAGPPDGIEQLIAREQTAAALDERRQQPELDGRQSTNVPPRRTSARPKSISVSPNRYTSPWFSPPSGDDRRSTARIRARSSRGSKGFVT
jgi:hypothetical protein